MPDGQTRAAERGSHPATVPKATASGHAVVLQRQGRHLQITDRGSRDGVFVNELRLLPNRARTLSAGDTLSFGGWLTFTIYSDSPLATNPAQPVRSPSRQARPRTTSQPATPAAGSSAGPGRRCRCGQMAGPNASFCMACGARLKDTCPQCQSSVEAHWKVCPRCGHRLAPA